MRCYFGSCNFSLEQKRESLVRRFWPLNWPMIGFVAGLRGYDLWVSKMNKVKFSGFILGYTWSWDSVIFGSVQDQCCILGSSEFVPGVVMFYFWFYRVSFGRHLEDMGFVFKERRRMRCTLGFRLAWSDSGDNYG